MKVVSFERPIVVALLALFIGHGAPERPDNAQATGLDGFDNKL